MAYQSVFSLEKKAKRCNGIGKATQNLPFWRKEAEAAKEHEKKTLRKGIAVDFMTPNKATISAGKILRSFPACAFLSKMNLRHVRFHGILTVRSSETTRQTEGFERSGIYVLHFVTAKSEFFSTIAQSGTCGEHEV